MADSVEMQDIRGIQVDKALKGFALTSYVFKDLCTVSATTANEVRWFQETAADLTATAPSAIANVSPLSQFPFLEPTWTRNTSYPKKYAAEGFISMEDQKSSDVDVVGRTLLRLTRTVAKAVDTDIWNVITESQSATNINSVSSTAAWDAGSGQNPIEDILDALLQIETNDYSTDNAVILLSPKDKKNLIDWILTSNGSNIPNFASALMGGGEMRIFGKRIIVSNNVTADYAAVVIPQVAATWKSHTGLTSRSIEEVGIGTKYRVWEIGIAILTDPKAVTLITNTQA